MTYEEILQFMLEEVPSGFDVSAGSFFYDIFAPIAVQLYGLHQKNEKLANSTDISTAVGEYLDRRVKEQDITRKAASYAKGTLKITGNKGEVIRQGTKAASNDLLFSADETVSIPDSGYIEVSASCTTPGSAGNVKAGEINRFPITLPGLLSVINNSDFTGGYDEESDAELYERYMDKVSKPTAGGTKYAYIEWAKEIEGVGDVQVIPTWNGAGTVKLIISDNNHSPADEELVEAVAAHIDTVKPIGAVVTVVSAEALTVNISVNITGNASSEAVRASITDYLTNTAMDKGYVSYAYIGKLIMLAEGVEDYTDLRLNGNTENIVIDSGKIPVLGEVSIS